MPRVHPRTDTKMDAESLEQEESERKFITQNFPGLRCIRFVQDTDNKVDKICLCGFKEGEHTKEALEPKPDGNAKWQSVHDTEKCFDKPAFGEIEFSLKVYKPFWRCLRFVPDNDVKDRCTCGLKAIKHDDEALRKHDYTSEKPAKWRKTEDTETKYHKDKFDTIPSEDWNMLKSSSTSQDRKSESEPKNSDKKHELKSELKQFKYAKYVRVPDSMIEGDGVNKVTELLTKHWKLKVPNLIISVTGGATSLKMNRKITEKFRQGIVRAAKMTPTWIITGGTYTGVMKHTGKAVRLESIRRGSREVVCIGIASWGVIENRESLIVTEEKRHNSAVKYEVLKAKTKGRNEDKLVSSANQSPSLKPSEFKAKKDLLNKHTFLDPNHTHFILVDSGKAGNVAFGSEIELRAALEKHMCETYCPRNDSINHPSVMVCCVLLQGGKGSLETACKAIEAGTPVVVIQDSGMAANAIARSYQSTKDMAAEVEDETDTTKLIKPKIDEIIREILKDEMKEPLSRVKKEEYDETLNKWLEWTKKCLQHRELITIYNLDTKEGTKDLDEAILVALLKANRNDVKTQLKLSVAWDQVHVAEKYLFTDEFRWKMYYGDVVQTAIVRNSVEFIKLFLKHGLPVEYIRNINLSNLYKQLKGKEKEQIQDLFKDKYKDKYKYRSKIWFEKDTNITWNEISKLLDYILADFSNDFSEELPEAGGGDSANDDAAKSRKEAAQTTNPKCCTRKKTAQEKNGSKEVDPTFQLFVYCVLLKHDEMAEVCLRVVRDAIPAALIATKIFKALADDTYDRKDKEKYEKIASDFEKAAYEILTERFVANPQDAQEQLTFTISALNRRTCLEIAYSAKATYFFSHPCCQALFTRVWYGKIQPCDSSWKKLMLLVTSFFIPPFLFALEFDTPKKQNDQTENANRCDSVESGLGPCARPESSVKTQAKTCRGKIVWFFNAPIVIFSYTIMSYIIFLIVMSWDILIRYPMHGVNWIENALIIYVGTMWIEQLMRPPLCWGDSSLFYYNMYKTGWAKVEMCAIVCFLLAMLFGNFSYAIQPIADAGRIFYAIAIILFFMKILHWYEIDLNVGPKIVMVHKMLRDDLVPFLGIPVIFLIAWGVAQYTLLFPQAPVQWKLLRDVLVLPFWQMFTQMYFTVIRQQPYDVPSAPDCSSQPPTCTDDPELYSNYTINRCSDPVGQWSVPILLAGYVVLTNLLLFNLLIAMFSFTFKTIQEKAGQIGHYKRIELISEFNSKPFLVPPFIILSHIFSLFKMCYVHECCTKHSMYKLNRPFKTDGKAKGYEKEKNEYILKKQEREDLRHEDVIGNVTETVLEALPIVGEAQGERKLILQNAELTQTVLEKAIKVVKREGKVASCPRASLPERQSSERLRRMRVASFDHKSVRAAKHPILKVERTAVPNNMVAWDSQFKPYSPNLCQATDDYLEAHFGEAHDPDLLSLSPQERTIIFNQYDVAKQCNRVASWVYAVHDGVPLNPSGPTGLYGRGTLPRWGPNQAILRAVVRRKLQRVEGQSRPVEVRGRPALEVLMQTDADGGNGCIPLWLLETEDSLLESLRDAVEKNEDLNETKRSKVLKSLEDFFHSKGKTVYEGYLDSNENTDNAWIEAQCVGIFVPDDVGQAIPDISGEDSKLVWTEVSRRSKFAHENDNFKLLKRISEEFGGHSECAESNYNQRNAEVQLIH